MRAFQFKPNHHIFLFAFLALLLLPSASAEEYNFVPYGDLSTVSNAEQWVRYGAVISPSYDYICISPYPQNYYIEYWAEHTFDFGSQGDVVIEMDYCKSWHNNYTIYIDGEVYWSEYPLVHVVGWTPLAVNISAAQYPGVHTIRIASMRNAAYSSEMRVYRVYYTDYAPYVPPVSLISFDSSEYNIIDTVHVDYNRCYDPDGDGELDLGWRWGGLLEPMYYAEDYLYLNVNAGDTYNDTWTTYRNVYGRKLSYLDAGNCWQTDHFVLGSDLASWRLNATLEKRTDIYFGVYGVYGRYLGTSVEVLDSDNSYVIGSTPDNITDGNPVIEVPIVPAYESNYTPPQPQPGDNSTLGTSFLGGYYQTVDSIIQPMNDTVSGAVSFVVSPVNTVSSSVIQVNGYATTTFDKVLFYVSPFGLFFSVIFDAIPNDTEIIIMFSLVCYLIAIVLRWK
jgi:hypothetical protein